MISMRQLILGVWQSEFASAFLYGLGLLGADLCFGRLRLRAARRLAPAKLGWYLALTFLLRLAIFLAGAGMAWRLFGRSGRFLVCLLFLLAVPLGIWTGARAAAEGEG